MAHYVQQIATERSLKLLLFYPSNDIKEKSRASGIQNNVYNFEFFLLWIFPRSQDKKDKFSLSFFKSLPYLSIYPAPGFFVTTNNHTPF